MCKGAAQARQQLRQQRLAAVRHLTLASSSATHEALHGGAARRGDRQLSGNGDQIEGLVVIAVAHARVDRLRRLEQRAVLRTQAAPMLRLQVLRSVAPLSTLSSAISAWGQRNACCGALRDAAAGRSADAPGRRAADLLRAVAMYRTTGNVSHTLKFSHALPA